MDPYNQKVSACSYLYSMWYIRYSLSTICSVFFCNPSGSCNLFLLFCLSMTTLIDLNSSSFVIIIYPCINNKLCLTPDKSSVICCTIWLFSCQGRFSALRIYFARLNCNLLNDTSTSISVICFVFSLIFFSLIPRISIT